jgi:hypothetical protein
MITLYTLEIYIRFFICMNLHSCFKNKLGWFQFHTLVSNFIFQKKVFAFNFKNQI